MADDKRGSLSGLTETEAKEFHGIFVTSFLIFTVIAIGLSAPYLLLSAELPYFHGDRDHRPLFSVAVASVVVSEY